MQKLIRAVINGGIGLAVLLAITWLGARLLTAGAAENRLPADDPLAVTPTPEVFNPLPADSRAFEAARADLAARLALDPLSVQRVEVTPTDWPDACLGLPAPAEACAAVITPGFRVVVSAQGAQYIYRTNHAATVVRLES